MIKRTNKCTNNGSIVRKKGRPELDVKQEIIKEIKINENPLSTSDLALKLNKAWHTIDRSCLMLQIDGRIIGFKVGKMNLWRMK